MGGLETANLDSPDSLGLEPTRVQQLGLISQLPQAAEVLALGAHCDDIEIGCGGMMLRLAAERPDLRISWEVFCSTSERKAEAEQSAAAFLGGRCRGRVKVHAFRDGFLPYEGAAIKDTFEKLKATTAPRLILTHSRDDRHQDHRLVSDLSWNTWRDHLILEYEIPKYDGDFGNPNVFVELPDELANRKVELLMHHFPSQSTKHWFTRDLFEGVMRVRGMESGSTYRFAEAVTARKLLL